MLEAPFWERYPDWCKTKPGGGAVFKETAGISSEHEEFLADQYFNPVAGIAWNPRYVNKREWDPIVRCFVDQIDVEIPEEWGIPHPNQTAAYKSLSKYGKSVPAMDHEQAFAMELAWSWTFRHFYPYMGNSDIISQEEAINHLDMTTSSGAPFNQHFHKKRDLFDAHPELSHWLEEDWNKMDLDWTCIFTNALKEELRPIEKIKANKIRTFLSAGVDAVVHGTRLFVDMNEKMYASHLQTASTVGMSVYGGNWNRLLKKLSKHPNGYALDETEYDSSLRAYLMWYCALLRFKMLKKELQTPANRIKIQVYYRNLVNSIIITPEGVFVMKTGGNPSGSVNTVTDNTLILYALLAYAWIRRCPEKYSNYSHFENETAKALTGDDNTWTVSDECHDFYNAKSVIAEWAPLGIITTTDSMEARKATELDYLSAHTINVNGMNLPYYDRRKLLSSLLYSPKSEWEPAVTLQRATGLLSIGWADQIFRKFCRDLIEWMIKEFDEVCCDDMKWIMAKTSIFDDDFYSALFMGTSGIFLNPQSLSGNVRKIKKPDKKKLDKMPRNRKKDNVPKKLTEAQRAKKRERRRKARQRRRARKAGGGPAITGTGAYRLKGKFSPADWLSLEGEISDGVVGTGAYKHRTRRGIRRGGRGTMPMGTGAPKVANSPTGEITYIEKEEYLGDLLAGEAGVNSTAFTVERFQINPGNHELYAWLSQASTNWTTYKMKGMIVTLKPLVADFSSEITIGSMFAATNFNPLIGTPENKRELENMQYAVSNKPSKTLVHPIECSERFNGEMTLLITTYNNYFGTDARNFDMGALFIGSEGLPNSAAGIPLAEIWISYTVELMKPQLTGAPAYTPAFGMYTGPCTNAAPFCLTTASGAYQVPVGQGNSADFSLISSFGPASAAIDTIQFPSYEATWMVMLAWFTAGTGTNAVNAYTFAGPITEVAGTFNGGYPTLDMGRWFTDTRDAMIVTFVTVSSSNGVNDPQPPWMIISDLALQTGPNNCTIYVANVPFVAKDDGAGWVPSRRALERPPPVLKVHRKRESSLDRETGKGKDTRTDEELAEEVRQRMANHPAKTTTTTSISIDKGRAVRARR